MMSLSAFTILLFSMKVSFYSKRSIASKSFIPAAKSDCQKQPFVNNFAELEIKQVPRF